MPSHEREVGATFEIHAITPTGGGHIMTIHKDRKDDGPLQFISSERLAQLLEVEAMMERMMGGPLEGGAT